MSSVSQISSSVLYSAEGISCFQKFIPNTEKNYLQCSIIPNPQQSSRTSEVAKQALMGSRPPQCENPAFAHQNALNYCTFKYSSMARCGCPTLDPGKHPEIWDKYEKRVIDAFVTQLKGSNNVTVTFFASGYLLQDVRLLNTLLSDYTKNWKGNLCFQFIDLHYEMINVENLANTVSNKDKKGLNLPLLLSACIASGVGMKFLSADDKQNKNKNLMIGGGLIILALILGYYSLPKEKKEEEKDSQRLPQAFMKKSDIEEAIKACLAEVKEMLSEGISLNTSFFSCAEDYIATQGTSDLVIGYDIEDSLKFLDALRKKVLNKTGFAIAMTKQPDVTHGEVPVLFSAKGSNEDLKGEILKYEPAAT